MADALFIAAFLLPPIVLVLSVVALLVPVRAQREATYENHLHPVSH